MDQIAEDYLTYGQRFRQHLDLDTALILDEAPDLQPLPDDERTAFDDPDGDEYGWDVP